MIHCPFQEVRVEGSKKARACKYDVLWQEHVETLFKEMEVEGSENAGDCKNEVLEEE